MKCNQVAAKQREVRTAPGPKPDFENKIQPACRSAYSARKWERSTAASAAAFVFTTVFTVVATVAAAEAAAVAAAVAAAPAAASVSEEKNSWTLNIIRFLVFVTLFLHGGVVSGKESVNGMSRFSYQKRNESARAFPLDLLFCLWMRYGISL